MANRDTFQPRPKRDVPASFHPVAAAERPDAAPESVTPEATPAEALEEVTPARDGAQDATATPAPTEAESRPTKQRRTVGGTSNRVAASPDRPELLPDEPVINLPVRVRRSLDGRLTDLVYQIKRSGAKATKAEVVEMLLWELPGEPDADFRARLAAYRVAGARDRLL